jgi:hypothetical protein
MVVLKVIVLPLITCRRPFPPHLYCETNIIHRDRDKLLS